MSRFLRTVLLTVAVLALIALVAVHGFVRAVVLLVVVALATALPRTRAWAVGERMMVRLTGSRQRAAAVTLIVVISSLAVYNIYALVR